MELCNIKTIMGIDLEKLRKALDNMTPEEMEEYFPKDTRPKGWISIEDSLPMMYAIDIGKGYTDYKVKLKDGSIRISGVSDHNIWYYDAKEMGITHWYND